jgi:putative ATP-dependent endonuclease of OLD family
VNEQHRQAKDAEINSTYTNQYVLTQAKNNKTEWALIFAYAIYQSQQVLPPLVIQMLDQIKSDLHYD